jgi:predicted phage baseplate assembly protein
MSLSLDASLRTLDDCGCCEGLSAETPVALDNRPGLTAIAYRAGTHALFKETLLARLSTLPHPALQALTARADDDFTIALLDAWAAIGDVLTFYQERIANENYLRTAKELVSAVELARLIDYRRQPGVAASVDLAFTIEEAPGALGQALGVGAVTRGVPSPPLRVTIGAGTRAQSIPGPDEQAQTFETIRPIEARAEWNAIRPRLRQPQVLSPTAPALVLQGTATNLKPGDSLLIAKGSSFALRRIRSVVIDDDAKTTRVNFDGGSGSPPALVRPVLPSGTVDAIPAKTELTDTVVSSAILPKSWTEDDLAAVARMQAWNVDALVATVRNLTTNTGQPAGDRVFAMRQRAAILGHNAPRYTSLPASLRVSQRVFDKESKPILLDPAFPASWEDLTLATHPDSATPKDQIFLDALYSALTPGGMIVLTAPSANPQVCRVKENVEVTRNDFAASAKVSRLTVEFVAPATPSLSSFPMRTTTVFAQSEELAAADLPVTDLVTGDTIVLDRMYPGLKVDQTVIVSGERSDLKGVKGSEAKGLKSIGVEGGFTVVTFQKSLAYSYLRATVTISGNVAPATHGDTVREVLGSGDASQSFQRFTLKQPPLTYVTAPTASGAVSTLEVRVNDILWREVPAFFGSGPEERVYVTRTDATGATTVMFGDGRNGTRLPTGQENVRATYRNGIGAGGVLPANRLTQLLSRPLGLKEVTNPLPSDGGADAERLEDVRRNAPVPIRTLGRIVSLQDYEDFARSFAGIAKSLATWTWTGTTRSIFVTVAGVNGAEVKNDTPLYANLLKAMLDAGDPTVPLAVTSYVPRLFRLAATIVVNPDFLPDKVLEAVRARLRERFSFDPREFGQPIALSEVIAVMQPTPGVVSVDVNELYRSDLPPALNITIPASAPRPGAVAPTGAELLTLDPRSVQLAVSS